MKLKTLLIRVDEDVTIVIYRDFGEPLFKGYVKEVTNEFLEADVFKIYPCHTSRENYLEIFIY